MTTKQFSTTATAVSSLHEDVRELCTHYVRTHTYTSECDVEVVYIMLIMPTPANTGVVIHYSYFREICASACSLTSFCRVASATPSTAAQNLQRRVQTDSGSQSGPAGLLGIYCIEAAWNLVQLPHLVPISNANAPAHNPLQRRRQRVLF